MAKKIGILTAANMLTFFRIALVPLYLWLFSTGNWLMAIFALVTFVTAAITDLYDGRLARSRKEITKLGKFLDPLADKFLVLGALAQFTLVGLVNVWLVAIILIRDIWVTLMRVIAIVRGTELVTSGNAKLKTTIQLTVVITIIVFYGARLTAIHFGYDGPLISIDGHRLFFNALVAVATVFTVYSWIQYILISGKK